MGPGLISLACQGSDRLLQPPQPSQCPKFPLQLGKHCHGTQTNCGVSRLWHSLAHVPPSPVCPSRCPCIPMMGRDNQQQAADSLPFVLLNFIPFPSC